MHQHYLWSALVFDVRESYKFSPSYILGIQLGASGTSDCLSSEVYCTYPNRSVPSTQLVSKHLMLPLIGQVYGERKRLEIMPDTPDMNKSAITL